MHRQGNGRESREEVKDDRMESGTYKIVTRLLVYDIGEGDASVISEVLGVQPTSVWRLGEPVVEGARNVHRTRAWKLVSPSDPLNTTPEQSIADLLSCFPDPTAFGRLPPRGHVQVTCAIYAYKERPFVFLPAQLMGQLARINADLDVDIYDLTSAADQ
jgi:hypothetical protein